MGKLGASSAGFTWACSRGFIPHCLFLKTALSTAPKYHPTAGQPVELEPETGPLATAGCPLPRGRVPSSDGAGSLGLV